ncbi:LemA family protein [Candidatus Synchoanobacter obligatus]|uniref:LemA family protein n=1 Tax=Candidatus Synchoanobacter obligatus TaxID=2919597 RepID=A0ABT1L666_9GAMM|nr:LemA family protein [Candidatus Synchoanobacter obligatus]MCP8352431.1 LemA family protein [Candidatus Synchoanobacter obligatus]
MFEYLLGISVLSVAYVIYIYNSLVNLREAAINDSKMIGVQLDRRWKVLQSLISAVSKYMSYEETVLKDVVSLRSQAECAVEGGDQVNRVAAENAISKIIPGLNVMVEAYPDLKANTTVIQLMEEIVSTENKLSFSKQSYNDSSERFNAKILQFPVNLVVGLFGEQFKAFAYWQLEKDDEKEKEDFIAKL